MPIPHQHAGAAHQASRDGQAAQDEYRHQAQSSPPPWVPAAAGMRWCEIPARRRHGRWYQRGGSPPAPVPRRRASRLLAQQAGTALLTLQRPHLPRRPHAVLSVPWLSPARSAALPPQCGAVLTAWPRAAGAAAPTPPLVAAGSRAAAGRPPQVRRRRSRCRRPPRSGRPAGPPPTPGASNG